jgi:putative ABC transport system permease protein
MYTVVGVMPADFQYPTTGLDAWIPAVIEPGELSRATVNNYRLVARLDRGMTLEQARREAAALANRLGKAYHPLTWSGGAGFTVDSMLDDAVGAVRPALRLLLGAVSFLLLIACVNLSNLFGARATARSGEFAVRLALGASRARLMAQAVAEAMPVLAIGALLGVVVARWAIGAFVANAPAGLPRVESIALNAPVVAYSLTVLILTGIAASIAPALQAWRSDFTSTTKDSNRSSTMGRRRSTTRRIGVAVQIAFAVPLLVGASLLIRSAMAVGRVNLGFVPQRVSTIALDVSRTRHASDADSLGITRLTRSRSGRSPACQPPQSSIESRSPGADESSDFENVNGASRELGDIDSRTITPEYFATLGIPLIAGRTFTEHDNATSPMVGHR